MPIGPRVRAGVRGPAGPAGPATEWRSSGGYLQYRAVGGSSWTNAVLLSELGVGGAFNFKGTVATTGDLPGSGTVSDLWVVEADGHGWSWNGTDWIDVGSVQGPAGADGADGADGAAGAAGVGVPTGGSSGQVLLKNSVTNYDASWTTPSASTVGLGNVNNTSDANKPVSTATQAALDGKLATSTSDTNGLERNSSGSGNLWRVRNSSTDATIHGVNRSGNTVLNGIVVRTPFGWMTGDPTPDSAMSNRLGILSLGLEDSVPSWVLAYDGYVVIQEVDESNNNGGNDVTLSGEWNGIGVADETAVAAGVQGTGDTAVAGDFTGVDPVVEATGVPVWYPSGARMWRHAPTGAGSAGYFTPTAGLQRRIRFHLRTPATWPGSAFGVLGIRNSTTDCARMIIGGTGQLRVANSGNVNAISTGTNVFAANTDYYIEFALVQNATAANGTVQVFVYDTSGSLVYSVTDPTTDPAGTGFGTTHDRIYFGQLGSGVTTTFYTGRFAWTEDPATRIGITA